MHKPVLALIILVAGVALAVAVFSIAGGYFILWGSGARVFVKSFDVTVNPGSMLSYITVEIVNVGGKPFASCTARILDPPVNVDDITPTYPLGAGQSASFYEAGVSGLNPTNIYQIEVVCTADDGSVAVDKHSSQAHI